MTWWMQTQTDERKAFDAGIFRRLMSYLKPYRAQVIFAVALLLVGAVIDQVGPLLLQRAIDDYVRADGMLADARVRGLITIAVVYVVLHVMGWFASYGEHYFMSHAGNRAIYDVRQDLFTHLQKLGFKYYDSRPAGVIMSRVTNDVNTLVELVSGGLTKVLRDVLTLVVILVFMVSLHPRLALYSFVVLPPLMYMTLVFRNRIREAHREVRARIAQVYANLQESISGVRVTQSFSREDENIERFDEVNWDNYEANMEAERLFSVYLPVVETIGALGTTVVLWYGGWLAINMGDSSGVTPGILAAFIMFMDRFYRPLRDLGTFFTQMQSAMAASENVFEIMDMEPEITDGPRTLPAGERLPGRVEFKDVSFGYKEGHDVVHGLNFTAEPGMKIALVGHTGAGKTTIINLLARFYDVGSGSILLDGIDLRDFTQEALRSQLGMVPQDTFLFSGTIKDNIRYGRLDATDEEIIATAKAINAHRFIEQLEDGYDTVVQERGGSLSGGQRQLIAFARALLRDPSILILDEATASIDAATELIIQSALEKLMDGRTSFIIAHRLSTIQEADKILVLEHGRIVERGTHKELLEQGGYYADLYRIQFKYTEAAS